MKYVVVPEVATKEMLEIMDNFDFEEVPTKVLWDVLMDNAPDTGMIAVDKVKFEALKALSKDLINKFENCLITNGTDPKFAAIATNKYRQALKDIAGDKDETKSY